MGKMCLQNQLLLYLLCCITIAFVIQFVVVRSQVDELQDSQIERINLELVDSKAGEIAAWFNQRLCETRIAIQHDGFLTMDVEKILPYLDTLNASVSSSYGDIKQPFVISNTQGTVFLQGGKTMDISQREYFQQAFASEKEYTISKPLYSRLEEKRVIIISYAVRDGNGKKVGYVHGSLSLEKIDEILSNISIYNGAVWILDNEGRVLAENENHIHGEDQLGCPQACDFSGIEKELLQHDTGIATLSARESGTPSTLFYADIPYAQGWKLCVMVDSAVMEASIRAVDRTIILMWALLALSAALLSVVYARRVMRPINRLADTLDALDLDGHAPRYHASGAQEILRLGNSFNRMSDRIATLKSRVVEEQEQKREVERRLLQAQINPHFLYNTLDTISWKALEHDAEEVSDLICALSKFFRLSLSRGGEIISLEQEMEHVGSYLYIQKARYEDKLEFRLELEEGAGMCRVPKLLIQPLVENAIYHGIRPKEGTGHLVVRARLRGENHVSILVADDGVGMSEERLQAIRQDLTQGSCAEGFGLCSMLQRLKLTYGADCSVTVRSSVNAGTVVRLILPAERIEEDV